MKKIAIIGCGGAGKSTLARQLGDMLHLEVIHLDTLYWKSGWVETPRPTWLTIQENLVQRSSWIIDGNYGSTMDIRLAAADTIIFLDMPRRLCLWRALKRRVRYHGKCRPDLTPGCPEQFDAQFLRWIWNFPQKRPDILKKLEAYQAEKTVIHLRSPRALKRFLKRLERERPVPYQPLAPRPSSHKGHPLN
jgi:adenylate kinase family enzyme